MEWFDGTVTEALSSYQEKNGIIIVYVHHPIGVNNDSTTKFNELWETFDKDLLKNVPVVAIRLSNDSEGAVQFAQFFPTPIFPVCYIIGLNGQPLEVITPAENLSVSRLNESLKKSINLYRDQLREKGLSTSTSSAKGDVVSEDAKEEKSADQPTGSDISSETKDMTMEERIQYARLRLEEKRKADAVKQEEEQRQKELERRNEGKMMVDAREKQKERELREAIEKRKREKDADTQALKALREQIKKDKEERARKAAGGNVAESKLDEPQPKTSKPEPEFNKPVDVDECRIQCRYSDGKTLVKTFPSKGALQAIVDAVKEDGHQRGEFFLVQTYPRRQLKELDKTLLELGLTPSSTLLVISKEGKTSKMLLSSGTGDSYLQLLLGFLYAPFVAVFQFISGIFNFGGAPAVKNAAGNGANDNQSSPTGNPQQRKDAKDSIRREGNIGRLRNESDSSDTEGTWNGNSTQQL